MARKAKAPGQTEFDSEDQSALFQEEHLDFTGDGYEAPKIEITHSNLDDKYWRLNNLYTIIDKEGRRVLFNMNQVQRDFFDELWYMSIVLKARQEGFTTFIDLYILDECLFNSDMEAAIIAHTRQDAMEIFRRKIKFPYDNLDSRIKEHRGLLRSSQSQLQFVNNSLISVGTSMRSATLQYLHVCLSGDTGIYTKNAAVKPISQVAPGDQVMTSKGTYRSVVGLSKKRLDDIGQRMIGIDVFGYYDPLKITTNHRVLTRQHKTGSHVWKKAGDVKPGDYLALPARRVDMKLRSKMLCFSERKQVGTGAARKKDKGVFVKPDFDFGWLCGFYLAEGTVIHRKAWTPTQTTFSVDESEVSLVLGQLRRLKDVLGKPQHRDGQPIRVSHRKDTRTAQVTVNSNRLAGFLLQHFGTTTTKHVPDSVYHWGAEFVRGLVKGYVDGDGSYKNTAEVSVTSTRRQLLDQLRMLLIALRFGVPTIYHAAAGFKYGRNCAEQWTLKLMGAANWKFREKYGLPMPPVPNNRSARYRVAHGRRPEGRKHWRRGRHVYWSRVTKIVDVEQEEFVYDLILDQDPHDYMTVNGVVHNSELGKIAKKYPEKAREIMTGALESVAQGETMVFVESTGEGKSGAYYELCDKAQKLDQAGRKPTRMEFKFNFFPWYLCEDYVLSDPIDIQKEMLRYFTEMEGKTGHQFSQEQKAWYIVKRRLLGDDIKREYPTCIAGPQLVGTSKGLRPIQEVPETEIKGLPYAVLSSWDKGIKSTVVITTKLGYEVRCTKDHPIAVPRTDDLDVYVKADNLGVGDIVSLLPPPFGMTKVVTWREHGLVDSSMRITEELARFAGYFMGDGCFCREGLSIVCDAKDEDVIEDVEDLMLTLFHGCTKRRVGTNKGGVEIRRGCKWAVSILDHLELVRQNSSKAFKRKVHVPSWVLTAPREIVREFLRGLFEADGFAQRNGSGVKLHTKYEEFGKHIQLLLLQFGITSRLSRHDKKAGSGGVYIGYELTLRTAEGIKFSEQIGFVSKRKTKRTVRRTSEEHPNRIPITFKDKIKSITPAGNIRVYDIETKEHHFSAGGIKVHNCPEEAFESGIEGTYFKSQFIKIRNEGRICSVPHYDTIMVDTWWDLGMDDSMSIWFTQDVGREVHCLNFYENSGEGLAFYRGVMDDYAKQYGYKYGRIVAPHDIKVRELATGISRLESAHKLGLNMEVAPKVESKMDAIEQARSILGVCWFDETNCDAGLEHLEEYRKEWDDVHGVFRDKPLHDKHSHCADAFQNLAVSHTFRVAGQAVGGRRKAKEIVIVNSQGWT